MARSLLIYVALSPTFIQGISKRFGAKIWVWSDNFRFEQCFALYMFHVIYNWKEVIFPSFLK